MKAASNSGPMLLSVFIALPGMASPHTLSRGKDALSSNATLSPASFNASAQAQPAGPAPIIITSYSCES